MTSALRISIGPEIRQDAIAPDAGASASGQEGEEGDSLPLFQHASGRLAVYFDARGAEEAKLNHRQDKRLKCNPFRGI